MSLARARVASRVGGPARALLLAGAAVFVAACGGAGAPEQAAPTATIALRTELPTTTAPPTTAPSTTAEPTTTLAPTTTAAAATTTEAPTTTIAPTTTVPATLPVPVAPPQDTRGQEPVVEVGSIEIPKIKLYSPMFEGIRLTTLDRGPGHWPGTAMPGDFGNVVVAGHRTSHGKQFRYLDQLAPGDEVIFTTAAGRYVYNVTSTEIVKPDAIWIVNQSPDKTATLFACHPVGSTRERIVVHLALELA